MVASKYWTKTDPKDDKTFAPTTLVYKLHKNKTSFLYVQIFGDNRTLTRINTKGRDPIHSYVEGLTNIESWCVKKSQENITRDSQYCWWCPKQNMEVKFYRMYINHTAVKYDDWDE